MKALVTGAGSKGGIGMACARLLGRAGCEVALVSTTARIHERAAELVAEGIQAAGHIADLTDAEQVAALRAAVGPVQILVNNAGMGTVNAPADTRRFLDLPSSEWARAMALSLDTAVLTTRAFLPDMVAKGYGRIVMMASVTGPVVSNVGDTAYSAAKAAMTGMTRGLALEVARAGVTVNAVLPGWIATEASTAAELQAAAATSQGRAGTPDEVAAVAAFLASEGASYVNGAMIVVDGANTLQESKA